MSASSDLPAPRIVATRLGTVAVAESGHGVPVLALHGGMGGCDQSGILGRALFADPDAYRLLAVARPGYPGTPLAGNAAPEQQADQYAALLDALDIDTVIVAAVSAGGPSAIQFAARYPARCRKLILVSAATGTMQTPPRMLARLKIMTWLARIPGMLAWLRRKVEADPNAAAARSANPELVAALDHPQAGPLLRLFQQSVFQDFISRLPGTRNDIAQLAMLPALPWQDMRAPLLIVHGQADFVVPPSHAQALAAAQPDARLRMLPGGGHEVLFTHMDSIRVEVADFLH